MGMSIPGQRSAKRSCASGLMQVQRWPEFATLQVFVSLSNRYQENDRDVQHFLLTADSNISRNSLSDRGGIGVMAELLMHCESP